MKRILSRVPLKVLLQATWLGLAAMWALAQNPVVPVTGVKSKGSETAETDKRKWVEATGVTKENAVLFKLVETFRGKLKALKTPEEKREAVAALRDLAAAATTVIDGRVYVVHVVEYVKGQDNALPESRRIRANDFYLYRNGVTAEEISKPRIYGNSNVASVFIVLNVPKVTLTPNPGADPANAKDEQTTFLKAWTNIDGTHVRSDFAALKQYLAVTKRIPANWGNVLGILGLAGYAVQAEGTLKLNTAAYGYTHLYGAGDLSKTPVPSDMDFTLGEPDDDPNEILVSSDKFKKIGREFNVLNEGRYHWDASIGLPVTNVRELEYFREGNTIRSREVSMPDLYAMGNFFLPFEKAGVDLADSQSYWKPRALFGVGIKGKPFDRMFFGMGMGLGLPGIHDRFKFLKEVQVFGGWARTTVTDKPAEGAPADQLLPQRTSYKFMFGLNIPVKSTAERLKAGAAAKK